MLAWALSVALIVVGWSLDWPLLAWLGLACSGFAAAMMVIRDNVKTRRVVRSTIRDSSPPAMRSL